MTEHVQRLSDTGNLRSRCSRIKLTSVIHQTKSRGYTRSWRRRFSNRVKMSPNRSSSASSRFGGLPSIKKAEDRFKLYKRSTKTDNVRDWRAHKLMGRTNKQLVKKREPKTTQQDNKNICDTTKFDPLTSTTSALNGKISFNNPLALDLNAFTAQLFAPEREGYCPPSLQLYVVNQYPKNVLTAIQGGKKRDSHRTR